MRYLLLICIMLSVVTVQASGDSSAPRILVVPFHPDYYLSDADKGIADFSDQSVEQIREQFRTGLQLNVQSRIMTLHGWQSESMLVSREALTAEDVLYQVYKGISYRMQPVKVPLLATETPERVEVRPIDRWKERVGLPTAEPTEAGSRDLGLQTASPDKQYLHAVVQDPAMLQWLGQHYGIDMILFVNQMEVVTSYEHCLDRAVDNFDRSVKVHFSLYNTEGNWLYGNAITMTTATRAMRSQDIIDENIVPIANFIAQQMNNARTNTTP